MRLKFLYMAIVLALALGAVVVQAQADSAMPEPETNEQCGVFKCPPPPSAWISGQYFTRFYDRPDHFVMNGVLHIGQHGKRLNGRWGIAGVGGKLRGRVKPEG
jgi:hypothetical protein